MSVQLKFFAGVPNGSTTTVVYKRIAMGLSIGSVIAALSYWALTESSQLGALLHVVSEVRDVMTAWVWSLLSHELVWRTTLLMAMVILCPIFVLSLTGCPYSYTLWLCFTFRKTAALKDPYTSIFYVLVCSWMARLIYGLSTVILVLQLFVWKSNIVALHHVLVQVTGQRITNTDLRNRPI